MVQTVSCWYDISLPELPTLSENVHVDVGIVGAGLAGLTAAYLLLKEGKSVAVVDQRTIGSGETGRTTAHLTYLMDDRLEDLKRLFGVEGLKTAVQGHKEAIDLIQKISKEEGIACDFERLPAYLFRSPTSPANILEQELACTKEIQLAEASVIPSVFSQFSDQKTLKFDNQAQFHPLKYLAGLYHAILKLGGKVYAQSHVKEIQGGESCQILTQKGNIIHCQYAIAATNVPINDRVIMHTKQAAYRSYVIAAEFEKGSVAKALYYDTEDPYHYVRVHAFGPDKELLIIGGEDHKTGQDTPGERHKHLEEWARRHFPTMKNIVYKWSGQIIEPVDSLAFLGKNPLDENVFIITGDSGQGMTHTTLGAQIICDSIMQRQSKYKELFDPKRKTLKAGKEFIKENLNVGVQYAHLVLPSQGTIESLPNCSGCVINKDLAKIAVYKDSKGAMHEMSAICPHLGCVVKWNEVEQTWDCPCHGSRFTPTGENLNGPATSPLSASRE